MSTQTLIPRASTMSQASVSWVLGLTDLEYQRLLFVRWLVVMGRLHD